MSHRIIFGEFEYANYLEWNWLSFISLRMATVFVVEEETKTKKPTALALCNEAIALWLFVYLLDWWVDPKIAIRNHIKLVNELIIDVQSVNAQIYELK